MEVDLTVVRNTVFILTAIVTFILAHVKIIMFYVDGRRRKAYMWFLWIIMSLYVLFLSVAAVLVVNFPLLKSGMLTSLALVFFSSLALSEAMIELSDAIYWRRKRMGEPKDG